MKPRFYIMLLPAMLVILLGACSHKELAPVELPPPMGLANAAVTGAQSDYDDENYEEASKSLEVLLLI